MKKHYIIIVLSVIVVFSVGTSLFFKLTSSSHVFNMQELEFTEADQANIRKGFSEKTETNYATYYISNELADKKLDYVRYCEILFTVAEDEYGLKAFRPQIYISETDEDKTYYGRALSLNPEDLNDNGKIFLMLSNYELPMWLCSGLENYWLNYYGEASFTVLSKKEITNWVREKDSGGLPVFGDAWFIRDFIEDSDMGEVQNTSFTLAQWLIENESLPKLIHIRADKISFQTAVNDALANFVELPIYSLERPVYTILSQTFSVTTSQAEYIYEKGKWDYNTIAESVPVMDNAIRYVKRFLQIEHEEPLHIEIARETNEHLYYGGYADYYSGKTYLNRFNEYTYASTIAHETTHTLTRLAMISGWPTDIAASYAPVFSEGLATMVEFHHNADLQSASYQAHLKNYMDYYNGIIYGEEEKIKYQLYDDRTGGTYKENYIDLYILCDVFAYFEMSEEKVKRAELKEGTSVLSHKDTYYQVCSFFQFIYNRYGLEKLMRVYYDFGLFDEEFGMPVDEMIELWKVSIGPNAK